MASAVEGDLCYDWPVVRSVVALEWFDGSKVLRIGTLGLRLV